MSPAAAVTASRPTGRAHAMRPGELDRWTCSLCDWSHPLDAGDTPGANVLEARTAFADDDRHQAARPLVEAALRQAAERAAKLEGNAAACRAGAQRVALAAVVDRWSAGEALRDALRAVAPGLAVALDTLAEVNR